MTIIKEIVLDGFKSYGTKTIFHDLNSKFNTITGINGSGKSNILDAICFVLGLSNLAIIRATKPEDLIYKNEKEQNGFALVSMLLYEPNLSKKFYRIKTKESIRLTRKIFQFGKNNYFLNNEKVSPQKILYFLHSINISINNPHFFIRQGHITRIARMNSVDLLQTVETAFGIKLYSIKKKNAFDLIFKKNKKLEEINSLLIDEIKPLLNKIGKSDFFLKKLEFLESKKKEWNRRLLSNQEKEMQFFLEQKEKKKEKINLKLNFQIQQKNSDRFFFKIFKKKNNFSTFFSFINIEEKSIGIFLKLNFQRHLNKFFIQKIFQKFKIEQALIVKYKKKRSQIEKEYGIKKKKITKNTQKKIKYCSKQYLIFKKKKTNRFFKSIFHVFFLTYFYLRKFNLNSDFFLKKGKFIILKILGGKKKILKKKCFFLENIKIIKTFLKNSFFYDKKKYISEIKIWKNIIQDIFEKIENLFGKEKKISWKMRFFIFGNLGSLIQIKKSFLTTALEFSNPSQSKMLLVDNEINSKKILDNFSLKKKISIIPLNKIKIFKKKELKNFTFGPIIEHICFNKNILESINFVFGNINFAPSHFDPKKIDLFLNDKIRTITPDGDVFETKGSVVTGKNLENGFCFLAIFSEFNYQKISFLKKGNNFKKEINKKKIFKSNEKYEQTSSKKGQLGFVKNFQSQYFSFLKLCKGRKKNERFFKNRVKIVDRFFCISNFPRKKKKKMVSLAKKKIGNFWINHSENFTKTNFSIYEKISGNISDFLKVLEDGFQLNNRLKNIFFLSKKILFFLKKKTFVIFYLFKKILNMKKKMIEKKKRFFFKLKKKIGNQNEKFKKILNNSLKWKKNKKFFPQRKLKEITKKFFKKDFLLGKIFSDFLGKNGENSQKFLDKKSMDFLIEGYFQYRELIRKRVMIEKDRFIIEDTVIRLDRKKNRIIIRAIRKVNLAFQAILSLLLPGSLGKLVIIRKKGKLLNGIDFRMTTGQNRSQTLEELSGGQKTILALSFIFSLLLSKPAPFYILDEIDAALDLCHTQNIGKLIREHFPMSQFLIVSLKNGIIGNSKVIFKIKNIQGKSVVTRISHDN